MNDRATLSPLALARLAGALYCVIIILGVSSELGVRATLMVPGDASATAENILGSQGLFRAGLAADTVMALCDVGLAVLLYVLLKPAGALLALAAMVFRLVQTAVLGANLLNQHMALVLLGGSGNSPGGGRREALALAFLDLHADGYDLALVFFGVASLLVGTLIARSGFLPRVLGWLVGAAGIVYLAGSFLNFLAPSAAADFAPAYLVPLVAETALALWLLFRGVDAARW